jgi:ABC-type glycerol-3-phosphate transport system permease component
MQPIKHPVARFLIYLILSLFVVFSVLPFFWTALQSFKTVRQANARTPLFFFTPTFKNYATLWLDKLPDRFPPLILGLLAAIVALALIAILVKRLPFPRAILYWCILGLVILILWAIPRVIDTAEFYNYFLNTLIVTAGTLVVSISVGCLAGYGLARFSGIDGVIILVAALAFRALPRLAFVLPYYWMGQKTGLHDTYFLVIICLVAVNQPFTIWMLRSFFMDIPREIEESAMVDGANRLTAFLKVIIPITWPGIISTALFTVLLAYNEFVLVLVLTQSKWTLPVAIAQFTGGEDPGYITLASAAAVSATIPIVILIIFFQKQLVKGLAAGAVKG